MWSRSRELEDTFARMVALRRRLRPGGDDGDPPRETAIPPSGPPASCAVPRVNLYDAGSRLILKADVPGLTRADVAITLRGGDLSIAGERRVVAPEGYSALRQERSHVRFSRALTLPCALDPEQTTATVKDGVLSLTLVKAATAQPRAGLARPAVDPHDADALVQWTLGKLGKLARLTFGRVRVTSSLGALTRGSAALPALDLFEDAREVLLLLDVAGATPSNTRVAWNDLEPLSVHVQRRAAPPGPPLVSELEQRDWYREIALPPDADGARARATVRDGVLTVRVPRCRTASGGLLPVCAA